MTSVRTRFAGLLGSRMASSVLQFGYLLLVARQSDLKSFGNYSLAVSQGAILTGLLAFGLPTMALRTPQEEQPRASALMLSITTMSVVPVALVTSVASALTAQADIGYWLAAGVAFVASEMVHNLVQNILLAAGLNRRAEVVAILRRAVPLACVAVSFLHREMLFPAAAVGNAASLAIAYAVVPFRPAFTMKGALRLLGDARHYWTASIGAMVQQLDVTIVSTTVGPAASGAYAAAFRLASPVHLVTASMVGVMVPSLVREPSVAQRWSTGRMYAKYGGAYAALLTSLSPFLFWIGPALLGPQYTEFAWVFPLMTINSALNVVNQILTGRIIVEGFARVAARASVMASAFGLLTAMLASLVWGLPGVVVGVILIQVALYVLMAVPWHRSRKESTSRGYR